jgi:Flp pilus assembly protein TadD/predicted Zn-dependent protease with MMP-like domain
MRVVAAIAAGLLAGCGSGGPGEPSAGVPGGGAAPSPPAVGAAAASASAMKPAQAEAPSRAMAVVECPVDDGAQVTEDEKLSLLLDAANRSIVDGQFGAAWTCADRAADLAPSSVEAHHFRGAALAGLGRDAEAQVAYALALALDPDDPETLRAVADFYVNGKSDRGRDGLRLGLELAQRGSRRVLARRRKAPALAAELALLEGQALNDLGRSAEALARIDVALKHAPGRGDALHERGVALFDLSRFGEARAAFDRALSIQPGNAFSHQLLGLTLEQLGDGAGAERELARAVELAPGELAPAVPLSAAELRREIDEIVDALPPERRERVRACPIEIADLPEAADLMANQPPFPPTILGLYRGPVGRGRHHARREATSIVLYRKNLARSVKTRSELSVQIRETLLHEIGHLEGLDEDDLRRRGMD